MILNVYFYKMTSMEIPPAVTENVNTGTQNPPISDYESQKKACLEAIGKISEKCASSCIILNSEPNHTLITEIESKGYRVTYTLDYDTTREHSFMCKLRITNPSYNDSGTAFLSAFEDNMKKIGFSSGSLETEESIKKLFNNIMSL